MNECKRVALYSRVSTGEQDPAMQVAELRDYAARRGWTIHAEYTDQGVSGTKSNRPELDKLMADARRMRFDVVLVWRFDRFARSTAHLLAALEEFRNLNIDFISLQEAIDTTTPLGKAVFTIVGAVAELERSIIIERVRAGVAKAKAEGKYRGRKRGAYAVDHAAVLQHLTDGKGIRATAREMGVSAGIVHRIKGTFEHPHRSNGNPVT